MTPGVKGLLIGCLGIIGLVVLLGIVGAVVGGGGGGSSPSGGGGERANQADEQQYAADASSEQPEEQVSSEQDSEEQEPPQVPEPEPITLTGVGQQATEPFHLEEGLTVVKMDYQGGGNFIVDLLDENGRNVAPMGIANVIGGLQGSTPVKIRREGEHILDVQASGPWEFVIEQPRPTSAPEKTSFSGDDKAATELFQLSEGLHTFHMTHDSGGNFIVDLLDQNGRTVSMMGLVNEIGRFDGSKAVRVPKDGIYLFSVEANGPWTIEIE